MGLIQDDAKVVARVKKTIPEGEAIEDTIGCSFLVAGDGAKGRPINDQLPCYPLLIGLIGRTRKMLGITFAGETKNSERILSGSLVVSGVDKEACKHLEFYAASVADTHCSTGTSGVI